MGMSTDAILCYGFSVGEEEETPEWLEPFDGDFDDFLASIEGLTPPYKDYDQKRFREDSSYHAEWSLYWEKKNALEKVFGIQLVRHCCCDAPMYILAIGDSVRTASRGYPEEIGQSIEALKEWRETLKLFCKKAGIEFQEPQYLLCSDMG